MFTLGRIFSLVALLTVASLSYTYKDKLIPSVPTTQVANVISATQSNNVSTQQETSPVSSNQTSSTTTDIDQLISSKLDSYVKQGKFRGPKGDKGDRGEKGQDGKPGQNGSSGISTSYTTPSGVSVPAQNLTVGYTPPGSSNPGSIGAITYLSSREQTTSNLTVSGESNLNTLNVSGNSTLTSLSSGSILPTTGGTLTNGFVTTAVVTGLASNFYNDAQKYIAVGTDGFVRFVYTDDNNTNVKFVQCLDIDCTTKTTTTVATDASQLDVPTLTMGSDGFARISYITYDSPNELHFIRCTNASCSTKSDNIVDVGSYYENGFTLDSNNIPQIAYVDYTNSPDQINLASCSDPSCSSVATSTLATVANSGNFSIKIAEDGFARIVYIDHGASPRELHYIQCTNTSCSTNNNNIIDTGSGMYYLDLLVGSDGFGRIGYGTADQGYKFTQCTNASCSTKTITVLDTNTDVHQVSIVLDSSGFPRISYVANDEVNYIKCNNASCSSRSTKEINSDAKYYTSMVMGLDDYPRIIYSSNDRGTLYLTRLTTDDGFSVASGSTIGSSGSKFGNIFGSIIDGSILKADELYLDGSLFTPGTINGAASFGATTTIGGPLLVNTDDATDCCDTFKAVIAVPGSGTTNPNGGLLISSNQNMDGNSALLAINNYDSQIDGAFGAAHKTNIFSMLRATKTGYDAYQPANIAAFVDIAAANLGLVNQSLQMTQHGINSSSGTLTNSQAYFYAYETTETNVPNVINYHSLGQYTNAAHITNMTDFKASNFTDNVTGTMTNRYGLLLDFDNTGITNAYGVYQSSNTVKNYFGGNVGLATTSPWKKFSVTGTVGFDGLTAGAGAGTLCLSANKEVMYSAGATCTVSSGRFKHDIASSTVGLDFVNKLRPVTFVYNEDIGVPGEQFGFIAEEVEQLDPRLVVHEKDGKPFSVRYENLTATLVKAIQEQQIQIDSIKTQLGVSSSTVIIHDTSGVLSYLTEKLIDGVLYLKEIVVDKVTATLGVFKRVETEELCLGGTCVTETEFKSLLEKNLTTPSSGGDQILEISESEVVDSEVASSTDNIASSTEESIDLPLEPEVLEVVDEE